MAEKDIFKKYCVYFYELNQLIFILGMEQAEEVGKKGVDLQRRGF